MDERLRALNRFGLGARVGERETLADPHAWLHEQLEGQNAALPSSAGVATEADLGDAIQQQRQLQQIEDQRT